MKTNETFKWAIGSRAATGAWAALGKHQLTVLAYHDVPHKPSFLRQMRHLVDRYTPVSVVDVAEAANGGRRLPDKAVLVTFDDGDVTVARNAAPVLAELDVPAVAFIVAGLLQSGEPYWWDVVTAGAAFGVQVDGEIIRDPSIAVRTMKTVADDERRVEVARLQSALARKDLSVESRHMSPEDVAAVRSMGVDIGHHSLTHPCLDRCDARTLDDEMERAHHVLTEVLGAAPRWFAYPNGNLDERAEPWLRANGYQLGFLFDHWVNRLPLANPLRISRVRVDATADLGTFRSMVSGLHPLVHRLRGGI